VVDPEDAGAGEPPCFAGIPVQLGDLIHEIGVFPLVFLGYALQDRPQRVNHHHSGFHLIDDVG